jgi:hypothetical protein
MPDDRETERLRLLAKCLGRPLKKGWLSQAGADATLILAVARARTAGDVVELFASLRAEMGVTSGVTS